MGLKKEINLSQLRLEISSKISIIKEEKF